MHFFYLDESGCNGTDLINNVQEQPIFVLGGISVRDKGWRKTYSEFQKLVTQFFGGNLPPGFELHASELLSPNGEGPFAGIGREERNKLALSVIELLSDHKHAAHFIALDKTKMHANVAGDEHKAFDARVPYLLAYNYIVSYIERFCKQRLGRSARGMIIVDPKEEFDQNVQQIVHYRRYEAPQSAALKWVVEFSYAIDSKRHPMIQISDLVIFLVRKFLEVECGFRDTWPAEAKKFYAQCYDKIQSLIAWKDIIPHSGKPEQRCHELLGQVRAHHRQQWRRHYEF
ncbi:DUF3800 domain-containing protein [Bradyrhizobium sp. UFLA06-06]